LLLQNSTKKKREKNENGEDKAFLVGVVSGNVYGNVQVMD
jgi:hypothetical protein